MRCVKSFGERVAARHPGRQTAEIVIRVALLNRFNALGTAEIARLAQTGGERGRHTLRRLAATLPPLTWDDYSVYWNCVF